MAANSVHLTRPFFTSELGTQAGDFVYDAEVPLRYWLRTADAIHKQAQFYERDGDNQLAYLMYMRYVLLFLEKLPSHPEAGQQANKKLITAANKLVSADLQKLEALKPGLNQQAQRYEEAMARRREAKEGAAAARKTSADLSKDVGALSPAHKKDNSIDKRVALEAREHTDLAAKLARRERRKRRLRTEAPESQPQGGQDYWQRDSGDLSKQLIEAGRRGQTTIRERNGSHTGAKPAVEANAMKYPSVPGRSAVAAWDHVEASTTLASPSSRQALPPAHQNSRLPPPLPPKQTTHFDSPPKIPAKLATYESSSASPPTRSSTSTPDNLDPREFTFQPSAFLESGTPLRTIFIPPNLRATFLKLASNNTSLNQEFLGILCGTLISNAFFITRLVLPPQSSTSDTCEMTSDGEVSLWSHCDSHDLLTLGWIHTHPTQTCFMSSRDLHTHSGYQAQMAESVAIVCAPRHDPAWGAFRLTDPPGLRHVLGCKQTGIFHPHNLENLYTDAMKPGHVCELVGLDFEVVDLR